MATGLGLRVGTYESVAAVLSGAPGSVDASEPEYIVRETVLHMTANGDARLGGTPDDATVHSVTDFVAKVGDPDGVMVGDQAFRPEDLVATAMFGLIEAAAPQLSTPSEICALHPANWSADNVAALRDALDYLGLRSVTLISEADAVGAPGAEPADAGALAALALAGGVASTEEFPAVITPLPSSSVVIAPAYSALADPPTPLPAAGDAPPAKFARTKRASILIAATFAAALAVTAGALAVALDRDDAASLPEIQAAAPVPSTQQDAPAVPNLALPTVPAALPEPVADLPAPVIERVVVPVVEAPPVTTPELPPAPPPPPPPPPPTTTPTPTTTPGTSTTTPTTTAPATTTTPATTTPTATASGSTTVTGSTAPVATTPPVTTTAPMTTTIPVATPVITTPPATPTRDAGLSTDDRDGTVTEFPGVLIPFNLDNYFEPYGDTTR